MTEATSLQTSILFDRSGAFCPKIGTILRSFPTPVSQSKQCKLNFELVSSQVPWVPDAFHARFPVSGYFFRLDRNLLLIKRSEMDPNVKPPGLRLLTKPTTILPRSIM